jgi:hypothetical protein
MATKAYANKSMLDVNVWFDMALYLSRVPVTDYTKAIHNRVLWNTGVNSLFSDAINGKYGSIVATSHIWRTLSYVLVNKGKLPAGYVDHIIKVFKQIIIATGGEPEVVVPQNRDAVDSIRWKGYADCSSFDHEDAKLVYEALVAKAEILLTCDVDLSMVEIPGLKIWYHDSKTREQRAAININSRRHPRR